MRTSLGCAVSSRRLSALTLVEVMIAMGLGSMVLACVGSLCVYGARSSVALLNYTDLDAKSRYASDVISRELRSAVEVHSFQADANGKAVTFLTIEPDASDPTLRITNRATVRWSSLSRTVVLERDGMVPLTALTECDRWEFSLFQRTPIVTRTNLLFFPATNTAGQLDLAMCKLVNMSWKCSRTILAQKVNTESVQAAQIVLRNKP